VNICFLTEKIPYSQICGTKISTSYKKRRLSDKHQQEITDLQLQMEADKKKVFELEETIETKIAQVKKLKGEIS